MWLAVGVAWAADPPVDPTAPYLAADPVGTPAWLTAGTVWLRDADLCFPARATDPAGLALVARVCEDPAVELVCSARFTLTDGWEWQDQECRLGLAGPSGKRTTEGVEPRNVPILADDHSAAWSPEVPLKAAVGRAMTEVRPCDEESLAALTKDARKEVGKDLDAQRLWLSQRQVVDGKHRCDASEGAVAVAATPGSTRTVTPGTRTGTNAVDCRIACPAPTATAAVEALQAQLSGRHWYDPAAPTLRLYPTKAECLASPTAGSHIDRDLCNSLGGQLRSQASSP